MAAAAAVCACAAVVAVFYARRPHESAKEDATDPPSLRVAGAQQKTVYERGLVTRKAEARSVLREHAGFHFNVSRRLSAGRVLGFVSPWSERGDQVAWRFGSKLTHLSPLMYGVDPVGKLVLHERPSWLSGLCAPPQTRAAPCTRERERALLDETASVVTDDLSTSRPVAQA